MKLGGLKVWNSALICWCSFTLFAFLFVSAHLVTVRPYPDMVWDEVLIKVLTATGAVISHLFAHRAPNESFGRFAKLVLLFVAGFATTITVAYILHQAGLLDK